MKNLLSYVLITPAKNEEDYIGKTIQSVVQQSYLPKKWVIVSDGSTDSTDKIVREYEEKHKFIEFLRLDHYGKRNFASKIFAFLAGYKKLNNESYDLIGNLDADITFDATYYEKIMEKFQQQENIGIAGGEVYDVYDGEIHKIPNHQKSVFGAVQMFRKECYQQIGGLQPIRIGGEDTVAEVMARQYGWDTKTFSDLKVLHHRRTGTDGSGVFFSKYKQGIKDHFLGYHPMFMIIRNIYRLFESPPLIGSILRFSGYWASAFRRQSPEVSEEFIRYLRNEQMQRIKFWRALRCVKNNFMPHMFLVKGGHAYEALSIARRLQEHAENSFIVFKGDELTKWRIPLSTNEY